MVKKCSCHWSIHREPGYVGIQVRTRRIVGSQSLRYPTNRHIIYINIVKRAGEGFNKIACVTSRHIRPFTHLQR